jgi:RNase P subunit RPR2
MITCQNCNTLISCGCQVRTASDGKQVCTTCVTSYEQNLAAQTNNSN